MQRRTFVKATGAAAVGGWLTAGPLAAAPARRPIGLELFTVLREMDQDAAGTLKKVAALGYQEVETSFSSKPGYYGLKPREFAALTKDLGLAWPSQAVPAAPFKLPAGAPPLTDATGKPLIIPPAKNLLENLPEVLDDAAAGGVPFLVCVGMPPTTLDEVKKLIDGLNTWGAAAHRAGLTFCYHNHDLEFKPLAGQVPYELLLAHTDAQTVKMELDLAWAVKGGYDPVELMRKHPGRFPLWHVKDLSANHQTPEPVGRGTLDFKRIFASASLAGLQHLFVEHDQPADPYGSITTSKQTLQKLLG